MDDSKVFMFPEGTNNGIDPNLWLALNNNGGFGGNGSWIWILFMWMIWGNGAWGNNGFGNNSGTGFLSNQINNNAGRDLLLQAINGRADAAQQLATITNTSVETVKNGIFALQNAINSVGTQVGMSGLETINAIQAGNATLGSQLASCCCENRLAICNQTNALQSSIAAHDASVRLQLAQNEASDQLSVCQQTNTLTTQASNNTNAILGAIKDQNAMIVDKFCDLEKRELQNRINTQGDIITQLRNQISNDHQTLQFNAAFHALDDKIDAIAAKQPNTVPVQWPNLIAANATPYVGQNYSGFYGNGFGNNIVF
jgi:hypothetical protein